MNIPVPGFLRDWGFALQESMLSAAREASSGQVSGAAFTAMAIAVVFGVVHIIGPGHGKLFTVGYFGSKRARLAEGLWLSALVNILDSLSAFLLVGMAYGVLAISLRQAGATAGYVTKLIAYGAVTLLSLGHLLSHLRHGAHEDHHHDHHDSSHAKKRELKPWMLAVSVGLIPCPVSSAILTWGIVNNVLGFAVLLVVCVSFGGMIAMTLFSLALIGGKAGITHALENRGMRKALEIFELAAMGLISIAGLLLFISAL